MMSIVSAAAEATVHLVDDDDRILKALGRLLGAAGHLVEEHHTAEEFLGSYDPDKPGCAILDVGLPGMDGFGIQKALGNANIDLPIIFLTGCGDIPAIVQAMKAGAVDFLTKPIDASVLLASVSQALQTDAEKRFRSDQKRVVMERMTSLTPREREVLSCVVAGLLNKQIAAELGTVEKTVKVHRSRMMEKMRVRTVADLVRLSSLANP
jgi:FixJ family two-component response regulator